MPQQPIIGEEIAIAAGERDITRGYVDASSYIPPQDPTLRLVAENYETYELLLQDDRIQTALQQRRAAVCGRPTEVTPGGSRRRDRMAADFMREQLEHVRWDTLTDRMLYGVFYGYSIAEVLWARDGAMVVADNIRVRNRRRFVFGPDHQPRLLTTTNANGEELPARKFWHFATGADNDDEPYGRGLASYLYWPAWFKKNHIKFWLLFSEKYGAPTGVGKYAGAASEEEKKKLLEAVSSIHQDSGIVIPEHMTIELLEASRTGSVDYAAFYDRMQSVITAIILSQTMTTEDGSSMSQAKVHMDVRKEVVRNDAALICDSFNRQVAAWLTRWNFPNAETPRIKREMDDPPDRLAMAQRDKVIADMGYRPTKKYLEETYEIELEDAAADKETKPAEFAESAREAEEREAVDAVLDALLEGVPLEELSADLVAPLVKMAADNPEELRRTLERAEPALYPQQLADLIAKFLFLADIEARLQGSA